MKSIFFFLMLLVSISSIAGKTQADNKYDVISSIERYVYRNGVPYNLSQVYGVKAHEKGFKSYYIYNDKHSNVFPFVFNREGIKGIKEPYSRCNLAYVMGGEVLIPNRKYKSEYAEDSEQCLGFDDVVRTYDENGVAWFITKSIYHINTDEPDVSYEVYFYLDGKLCFSQVKSQLISIKGVDLSDLKYFNLNKKDFLECSQ